MTVVEGGNASTGGTVTGGAPTGTGGVPAGGGRTGAAGTMAAGGSVASDGAADADAGRTVTGTIVPLYAYPTDTSWTAIAIASRAHPKVKVVAIVNPDNGPGTRVDPEFTKGIATLSAAGLVPIGYVSTSYTQRGEAAVKADVDRWHTEYPATRGIFFDEQSNKAGDEGFYRDVSSYAKAQGFSLTVGNPGTATPASFLDTVDVMLIYESAGAPQLSGLTRYAPERSHYGIIPYAATFDAAYVKSAARSVEYVYITDDDLPNPWDSLPAFFEPMLAALDP
jgi:hypothetical protein